MKNSASLVQQNYSRREIVEDLENYLKEQSLPQGTRIAPASKLALRYNVSVPTINRALERLVARKLVYRVRGSGTYTASRPHTAKRLRVGIFLSNRGNNQSDPYNKVAFGNLNSAFLYHLQNAGHEGLIFFHELPAAPEELINAHIHSYDVVILQAGSGTPENIRLLQRFNLPTIMIMSGTVKSSEFNQVCYDYRPGFRKLLVHLSDRGYQRFLVAGLNGDSFNERSQSILSMAEQLGIPVNRFKLKSAFNYDSGRDYWHNLDSGRELGEYFLANRHHYDAVISVSDYASYGFVHFLRQHQLEPGHDYAIASYDNFEGQDILLYGPEPILTAITHPLERMAEEAVKLAVSEGLNPSGVTHIIQVPAQELVIRKSTQYQPHKEKLP